MAGMGMRLLQWLFPAGRSAEMMDDDAFERRRRRILRKTPPPILWLLGKTGSGKSSVVRFLTGDPDIAIGPGFVPTTDRTSVYDFPDAATPLVRFLDTRGIGEAHYDPSDDLAALGGQAHAILLTHKLLDLAVDAVIEPLRVMRRAAPDRPVLLLLTWLHEAYPGAQHPPYAYDRDLGAGPEPVRRALFRHRDAFGSLVDRIIPIDLTRPEDGFEDPDYGGRWLRESLLEMLPRAYGYALRSTAQVAAEWRTLYERRAMSHVHASALLAAAASTSPIPWIDLPFLLAIQGRLVRRIAAVYGLEGSTQELIELVGATSTGFAMRMGIRSLLKLIPGIGTITGSLLGAAFGFTYTYALGRAACWYYGEVRQGNRPKREELLAVFRDEWKAGAAAWKDHRQRT